MPAIEQELVEATKVPQFKNRRKFLLILVVAANALPDDDWDRLSPEAQTWCNDATQAIRQDRPVPDFPELELIGGDHAA